MLYILLLCSLSLYGADALVDISLDTTDQERIADEVAKAIVSSLFRVQNGPARSRLQQRLRKKLSESESASMERLHVIIHDTEEPLHLTEDMHDYVVNMFKFSIEEEFEEQERQSNEWHRQVESRCERSTTIALSTCLALVGTAIGAAVSAAITQALS